MFPRAHLVAFCVGFLVASAVACGPTPRPCGAGCQGCCDEAGECVSGTALLACGSGGATCERCEANLVCAAGACVRFDGGDYDASFADDPDASFNPDAGVYDAGPAIDGGPDAGADAGRPDSGVDAGAPDAGRPDAGPPDAGRPDAGPPDAGTDGGADAGDGG